MHTTGHLGARRLLTMLFLAAFVACTESGGSGNGGAAELAATIQRMCELYNECDPDEMDRWGGSVEDCLVKLAGEDKDRRARNSDRCYEAQFALLACLSRLDCQALDDHTPGEFEDPDLYPCRAEDERAYEMCPSGDADADMDGDVDCDTDADTDTETDTDTLPLDVDGACSADGWCWQNPMPQAESLNAVWAADETHVWAVSEAGALLFWDDETWAIEDSGSAYRLNDVWGTDTEHVWAVSSHRILFFDGVSWQEVFQEQWAGWAGLQAIWGLDASHVWAVGWEDQGAAIVLFWDGTSWTRQETGTRQWLVDVWAADPEHVWAVGQGSTEFSSPDDRTILFFDGTRWTEGPELTGNAIWGTDAEHVWIAGHDLHTWNGTTWSTEDLPHQEELHDIWGLDASHVWALGSTTRFWDGTGWQVVDTPCPELDLQALGGSAPENLWAVGDRGAAVGDRGAVAICHFDGAAWEARSQYLDQVNPRAIWGADPQHVWAVGDSSAGDGSPMLFWNGARWSYRTFWYTGLPTRRLYDIWGADASHVWAVGAFGVIRFFNGTCWRDVQGENIVGSLRGVWAADSEHVWAVGDGGRIFHFDGQAWVAQDSGTEENLHAVWGVDPAHVWATGEVGTIRFWDGTAWTAQASGTDAWLTGVWGADAAHVWVVGSVDANDTIVLLFWNGESWQPRPAGAPRSARVFSVWGTDRTHAWAVGYDADVGSTGVILAWDGTAWSPEAAAFATELGAVWGTDAAHVWAVGSNEILFRGVSGR